MTEAQTLEIFEENIWFFMYIGALLIAGLGCWLVLIKRYGFGRGKLPFGKVREWRISWADFGLLIWIVFCWIFLSMILIGYLFESEDGRGYQSLIWQTVAGGFAMQVGVIAIIAYLRVYRGSMRAKKFNTHQMSVWKVLPFGLFVFMTAFPAVSLVSYIWMSLLTYFKSAGYDVPAEQQEIVNLFTQAETIISFLALWFMATVLAPVAEELLFRGAIYRFLKGRCSTAGAMLISAVLFSLVHFNVASFPSLVVMGIFLCVAYELSGNLEVSIVFHSIFNLNSIFLIYLQPELPELIPEAVFRLAW